MIKAIIFDFDGVIVESSEIKTIAFKELFEIDYREKTEEIISYHINNMGISRYVKFRHIYNNILKLDLSPEKEKELGEEFSRNVLEKVLKAPFVPGAQEFLELYHSRFPLFIASGTPEKELNYIAKRRGIFGLFNRIYGTPPGKTEIILHILAEYGWAPGEVVFIGDAETDLVSAMETGVRFIARIVKGCDQLINYKYRVNDLGEIVHLLPVFAGDHLG